MRNRLWIYIPVLMLSTNICKGIPSCDPNPCRNGAPCELMANGIYQCRCGTDYVGDYCQNVNPCLGTVCKNNATCQVSTRALNHYTAECICQPGYTGTQCEYVNPASVCYNSPCKNGGSCVNSQSQDLSVYRCDCKSGFMGMHCETIDYCVNQPCSNGATCTSHSTGYTCKCKFGFTGDTCKEDIDECAANPNLCQNGGSCENQYGSYFCNCPVTYRGQLCEQPYIPCSPDPCQNNGLCLNTSATTYQCTCLSGKFLYDCFTPNRKWLLSKACDKSSQRCSSQGNRIDP